MKAPERPTFDVRGEKRDKGALVVSIIVHVALFILISGMVIVPALDFLVPHDNTRVTPEQVTFIEPPKPPPPRIRRDTAQPPPKKSQEPPPPAGEPPAGAVVPPITPPVSVPAGIAPPKRDSVTLGDTLDRRMAGGGGVPGLTQGQRDPRLMPIPPGRGIDPAGPLASEYRGADSLVHSWVRTYWDSLARVQANGGRKPGDWTFDRNGTKYGVDQQWIYFGKFKLPAMLLALLPIKTTANPTLLERNRALESMRWEIDFQARRASNQMGFTEAVKELRERKEREHQAAEAKRKSGGG